MVSVVNRHDREPLRPIEVLPRQGSRPSDLNGRYPTVLATTGSCARPRPSPSLWSSLGLGVCAGCCEPLLRRGPSRRYLCTSFPACLDPYPGGSCGAHARFFPHDIGLPPLGPGRRSTISPPATSGGTPISGLQSFAHVQASRFAATQVAPTVVSRHEAAVAFTSEQYTSRYLPVHRIC